MGAVVSCLDCNDTFQAGEEFLQHHYLHAVHTSPEGIENDVNFFINEGEIR